MDTYETLRIALAVQLDAHEHAAAELPAGARDDVCREIAAKRSVLAGHLPIESIYGLTCKRCVSWQEAPGELSEFGIAIPDPWPCLPVAAIAASSEQNLALAVEVLTAGRAMAEAEFLATLPDRMQAIADLLSVLLPGGLWFTWPDDPDGQAPRGAAG